MINIENNFLQFCCDKIIWQSEESFTTNKLFYYLVSKEEFRKTKIPFFECYICYKCYTNKNNELIHDFVTLSLHCNRKSQFLPFRHTQDRHQTPNVGLYFLRKTPP
jgi:hypothetical protein